MRRLRDSLRTAEGSPARRGSINSLLQVIAVIMVLTTFWMWDARRLKEHAVEAERLVSQRDAEQLVLLSGFEEHLGGVWLSGRTVGRNQGVAIDSTFDGVIYSISSKCPPCVLNVPILHAMIDAGITVIGVAPYDDSETAEEWVKTHSVRFPVLTDPEGPLMDLLRHAGSPFTLFRLNGNLGRATLGLLRQDVIEAIIDRHPG